MLDAPLARSLDLAPGTFAIHVERLAFEATVTGGLRVAVHIDGQDVGGAPLRILRESAAWTTPI